MKIRKLFKQFVEQLLHFIAGFFIILAVYWAVPVAPLWLLLFSGCIVAVREFIIQRPIERPWDTALDISFWLAGSTLAVWVLET